MNIEEERKLILKMLKEEKINEDEALRLLDALKTERVDNDLRDDLNSFINRLTHSAIDLGKRGQSFISGLDLNSINLEDVNKNSKLSKEINKNTVDIQSPSLVVDLSYGSIELSSWDNDSIEIKADIAYNDKQVQKDYDFFKLEDQDGRFVLSNNYDKATKDSYSINYELKVPSKSLESLEIRSVNTKISLENILANSIEIESTNGSIDLSGLSVETLKIESVNGKIGMTNIISQETNVNNINGRIDVDQIDAKNISLVTSHGPISISKLGKKSENLKAKTHIGNISLDLAFFDKPIKASLKNLIYDVDLREGFENSIFTNFIKSEDHILAYSDNYREEESHLLVNMETSNGKIFIS